MAQRVFGDGRGRHVGAFAVNGHVDLAAQNLQLLDRGRTVDVTGHQQGALAVLAQTQRQLGGHGRLACALQPHQHDDVRRRPGEVERRRGSQQGDQLLVHDLDDLLGRRQAAHDFGAHGPFLDRGHKILDHFEVDVRFQQGQAHFTHGRVDVRFRQFALAAQLVKDSLEFVSKTLKHCVARLSRPLTHGRWQQKFAPKARARVPTIQEQHRMNAIVL